MSGESSSVDFSDCDLPKFFELFNEDDRLFLRLEEMRFEVVFGLVEGGMELLPVELAAPAEEAAVEEEFGAPVETPTGVFDVVDEASSSEDGIDSCLFFKSTSNLRA